ncbi:hypothetical protein Fmac_008672 [Flemingia macrophylla]|uniref:Uncharacterized protein n=1 Tax=Flemingia macrophylla TaxID=520843 RepID=A0ABD1MY31_9FABA
MNEIFIIVRILFSLNHMGRGNNFMSADSDQFHVVMNQSLNNKDQIQLILIE